MQPVNKRIFTEEEIQYLKDNYATTKNKDLCERLGIGRTLLVNTESVNPYVFGIAIDRAIRSMRSHANCKCCM